MLVFSWRGSIIVLASVGAILDRKSAILARKKNIKGADQTIHMHRLICIIVTCSFSQDVAHFIRHVF